MGSFFIISFWFVPTSTLAWKIPWMEEPGRLRSMGSLRVGHDWATSLSLFTFTHWRRKWQPTPVFLPGVWDGGAWWAAVYGVAQSRTRLTWLSSSSNVPSQVAQWYRICLLMWVWYLGWEEPWRKKWQPNPGYFLSEKFCGQRSLAGYSIGVTESQTRLSNWACTQAGTQPTLLMGRVCCCYLYLCPCSSGTRRLSFIYTEPNMLIIL